MRRIIAAVLIIAVALGIGGAYFVAPPPAADTAADCPADALRQAQSVIVEQTRAMSAQDFAAARTLASRAFQDAVTVTQFADIISNDYPYLLQNPQITFGACELVESQLLLLTASFIVDGGTNTLAYAMVYEQGGWYINVAASRESQTQAA